MMSWNCQGDLPGLMSSLYLGYHIQLPPFLCYYQLYRVGFFEYSGLQSATALLIPHLPSHLPE